MTIENFPGTRFGKLTVIGDSGKHEKTRILWRCRCDCGNEILLPRNLLTSGIMTSCGCDSAGPKDDRDLTGRVFGDLTVISRAASDRFGRAAWNCRCKCGNSTVVLANCLRTGRTQSCGCRRRGPAVTRRDLAGRRFGRLTVQDGAPGRGKQGELIWHCICDCGKELDVSSWKLLSGHVQSCGCLEEEQYKRRRYENDTGIDQLCVALKNRKDNTSGFRGVRKISSRKWDVSITFRKVRYRLGSFDSFEEAVETRKKAEAVLHAGYVKSHAVWEEKAMKDPQWAKENPFYYEVEYESPNFRIRTNGEMP